jgi:hypothetical protein
LLAVGSKADVRPAKQKKKFVIKDLDPNKEYIENLKDLYGYPQHANPITFKISRNYQRIRALKRH